EDLDKKEDMSEPDWADRFLGEDVPWTLIGPGITIRPPDPAPMAKPVFGNGLWGLRVPTAGFAHSQGSDNLPSNTSDLLVFVTLDGQLHHFQIDGFAVFDGPPPEYSWTPTVITRVDLGPDANAGPQVRMDPSYDCITGGFF